MTAAPVAAAPGGRDLALQVDLEVAAVGEPGERIGERQRLQVGVQAGVLERERRLAREPLERARLLGAEARALAARSPEQPAHVPARRSGATRSPDRAGLGAAAGGARAAPTAGSSRTSGARSSSSRAQQRTLQSHSIPTGTAPVRRRGHAPGGPSSSSATPPRRPSRAARGTPRSPWSSTSCGSSAATSARPISSIARPPRAAARAPRRSCAFSIATAARSRDRPQQLEVPHRVCAGR